MSIIEKKYKLIKMAANTYYLELMFILLNIFQPQKLIKVFLADTSFLKRKDKKHQKKKLVCKFIRINTSKCYDDDYEFSRVKTFISKIKDTKLKKLNKKLRKNQKTKQKN